ncbi:unnamed protein product [Rotaria sordida]|uniref:Diacylglycerol kinase n=1 Tax=Rotaria sordida TaxID=392033 RepID=A0A814E9T7_9BILA|nr:unnamed protein product [Rotaria sordida]
MVITRSQSSVAASTAAALKCTCKINREPKSSTRSRPVNKTSKRAPSPSPPNPIHRSRSKLSKKILGNSNANSSKKIIKIMDFKSDVNNDREIFNEKRISIEKISIDIDTKSVKNKLRTSTEILNDYPDLLTSNNNEQLDFPFPSSSYYRYSVQSDRCSFFGVDWSDKAHPRSHCWLPNCSMDSSPIPRCANIIVRPQWLHRVANSPVGFQAQFPDNIDASNSSLTPLIVFINELSGGQKGKIIYHKLLRLLNPRQVFLLENDTTVMQALDIYSSLRNTRILLCGGDGTVGWILSTLANRFSSLDNPPVGICPMGTGNDLSRVLGWGWSYNMKQLLTTLLNISNAKPIILDRWQVDFEPLTRIDSIEEIGCIRRCLSRILDPPKFVREIDRPSYQNYQKPLNVRFTNYISFGLDAAVVLDFHNKRMQNPSKFTSPMKNKLMYLNIGRQYFREFALWRAWNLRSYMRIICDGQDMTNSLRHCHTVVFLNIPSYGSGTHPWSRTYQNSTSISNNIQNQINSNTFHDIDPPDFSYYNRKFASEDISNTIESSRASVTNDQIGRQSIDDHKIEVIGLDSIQMALIHIGFRGRRIAQCSQARIELIRSMPVHMDGDPFYLPQSTAINVTHAGQVLVLTNDNK